MDARRALLDRVAAYYTSKVQSFGPTARGVDWNGVTSHELRHQQFLRLIADEDASVIDLGCGFGDFYRFLRGTGHRGRYTGLDVSAEMIAAAKKIHGEGNDRGWSVGTLTDERADFAIASGLFNVKGDEPSDLWSKYVLDTVGTLANAGKRGFAFNVLSLSSDPERRRGDLYYADPVATLEYCLANYGRSAAILQDYGLYEFTILVRHTETAPPTPSQNDISVPHG